MSDVSAYLNSLPESHWRKWHEDQDRFSELLDGARQQGMSVEQAADYACQRMAAGGAS